MKLPTKVHIMEVGPRDGFQMEHQWIPTERKIEIVNALSRTGLTEIQATSFVHPRAVPNLADAEELMAKIDRVPGVRYQVLVPNRKGMERALPCKPDGVHLMMSVTESHNRANANRSVDDSLRDFEELIPMALAAGVPAVEAGLACVFGCPFEGEVPWQQVERVVKHHVESGVTGVNLGDTIGVANPRQVYDMVARLLDMYPNLHFSLHGHNTRDMALANILAAMQAGLTSFDTSLGGMGGCPYAPGATGNISTEDTVNMLTEMGIETGIDLDALLAISRMLQEVIPHPLDSGVVKAGRRTDLKAAPREQQKIG